MLSSRLGGIDPTSDYVDNQKNTNLSDSDKKLYKSAHILARSLANTLSDNIHNTINDTDDAEKKSAKLEILLAHITSEIMKKSERLFHQAKKRSSDKKSKHAKITNMKIDTNIDTSDEALDRYIKHKKATKIEKGSALIGKNLYSFNTSISSDTPNGPKKITLLGLNLLKMSNEKLYLSTCNVEKNSGNDFIDQCINKKQNELASKKNIIGIYTLKNKEIHITMDKYNKSVVSKTKIIKAKNIYKLKGIFYALPKTKPFKDGELYEFIFAKNKVSAKGIDELLQFDLGCGSDGLPIGVEKQRNRLCYTTKSFNKNDGSLQTFQDYIANNIPKSMESIASSVEGNAGENLWWLSGKNNEYITTCIRDKNKQEMACEQDSQVIHKSKF